MFFFQSILVIYCIGSLIIGLKNYHSGKDSKYTNDINVKNALCCPTPTALRPKNIPAVVAATVVMSSPSPIRFLTAVASTVAMTPSSIAFSYVFLTITVHHLSYKSKAYDVVLVYLDFH